MQKDLNQAQKELEKFKKNGEKLNNKKLELEAKVNIDYKEYQKQIRDLKKEYNDSIKAFTLFNGTINPERKKNIDADFEKKILNINENSAYIKSDNELRKINKSIIANQSEQKKWNIQVDELKKKMLGLELADNGNAKIESMNKSILQTIKHVGRLAIAVFGLRSVYGAVSRAASILGSYNEQIGNDLEYIRFALATTLQPVIETLISLVFKFLSYVNYLAKAWFGVNLFAKATTDNFNKSNKSAKNLKKTLGTFNFDDLNILQENNADKNEVKSPSVDLSGIEDIKPPKWLEIIKDVGQWVLDHWKGIVLAISLVGAALIGIKLAKWIKNLKSAKNVTKELGGTFKGFFDGLGKGLEALGVLGGIALVIKSVSGLIDSFSQSGLSLIDVAGLLAIVLGELTLTFISMLGIMTLLEPSWQSIAAAAVIFGGLALVISTVSGLIDSFSKSGLSLTDVMALLGAVLVTIVGLMGSIVLLGPAMTAGLGPFLVVIGSISALLLVMSETLPIILEACGKFIKDIAPLIIEILKTIGKMIQDIILALGISLPPIINSVGNLFERIFHGIAKVIETVGNTLVKILNSVAELVPSVLNSILDFINRLGPAINNFVDGAIRAITKLINFLISGIEYMINTLVIDAINGLISAVNNIPLVDIPNIPRVNIQRFRPVLMATGGIIDVPKRGVPLANNVIGGEAGAEGVLPLTDEDTMARLGKEIGQWITLNIDLTGKVDMRVLFREFVKYYNEQKFSMNGGGF